MNFPVSHIPERSSGDREYGITMMMEKGLSLSEASNFIESSSEYTDLVKFGFGTALITKNLREKVALYQAAGLKPYFGGTLFEMFFVRNQFEDYRRFVSESGLRVIEVSDGSIRMEREEKLKCIEVLSKDFQVLSEVGSKVKGVEITNDDWATFMKQELDAGAWKVIGEARESGTNGLYQSDGSANRDLIDTIMKAVSVNDVLWEAPNTDQQMMFIKMIGANVNLGNIAPAEVVALEALRCGMRGDTLFDVLPVEFQFRKL